MITRREPDRKASGFGVAVFAMSSDTNRIPRQQKWFRSDLTISNGSPANPLKITNLRRLSDDQSSLGDYQFFFLALSGSPSCHWFRKFGILFRWYLRSLKGNIIAPKPSCAFSFNKVLCVHTHICIELIRSRKKSLPGQATTTKRECCST